MNIQILILSFFIFSFIGWAYESLLLSFFQKGHFINRGFFLGPYCPIYGAGAILCWLMLNKIQNPWILFISAAIICSIIEYLTSYVMEKLFHARWWDYSNIPLNINGRICLGGALLFALGCLAVNLYIEPWIIKMINYIPVLLTNLITLTLVILFIIDIIFTINAYNHFNASITELYNYINKRNQTSLDSLSQQLSNSKLVQELDKHRINIKVDDIDIILKKHEIRFINAFPNLKMPHLDHLNKLNIKQNLHNFYSKHKHDEL